MKRAYITQENGEGLVVAFVATSSVEARKMAFYHDINFDEAWIDVSVKWVKGVDVSDLPIGEIDEVEGVKRGIYYCLYERLCIACNDQFATVFWDKKANGLRCSNCDSEGRSEYDNL